MEASEQNTSSLSTIVTGQSNDSYGGSTFNLGEVQHSNPVTMEESNPTEKTAPTVDSPKGCVGTLHVFSLMAFFGLAVVYMLRVNLSVAIIDMVNQTHTIDPVDDNLTQLCPVPDKYIEDIETNASEGEFSWDNHTKGLILGCFFWGYIVTQIPGGSLAERYRGKYVFGLGVFFTGFFSIFMPIAARSSPSALIALRVLTGAAEGVTIPSLHAMIPRWIPFNERSTLGAFILAGMQFGTVISLPLSGYLCEIQWDNGWPLAFYVPGSLAVVWFIFWIMLIFDGPDVHPRIAEDEKKYILDSTGRREGREGQAQHKKIPIPWLSILTSIHFWAILVAHVGQNWEFYVLLTELPTYMKTVLHFDLKSNSLLSALPYLAMWILSNVFSVTADALRAKKMLNLTQTRKVFQSIGTLVPACALIGASYTGCDRVSTIALITVAVGFNGAVYSGFNINHIDISPNFASIMMGFTNSASNICGFLAPYIVALIVTDEGSLSQWSLIFFVSAGVYVISDLFFVAFGTGEVQKWNEPEDVKEPISSLQSST